MADLASPKPPYLRIADDLRALIEAGAYGPDDRLPSMTELANDYEVSVNTVQKALRILKAEGLVDGVAGYGTFVRKPAGP